VERRDRVRELLAEIDAHTTDEDRDRMRSAAADMYDEYGLPQ
jgi:hypothetical protein